MPLLLMMFLAASPLATVLGTSGGNGLLNIPSEDYLAAAHCPSICGDVSEITYPFGIGPGCFRQGFELVCDNTTQPPTLLFLGNTSTQISSTSSGWYEVAIPAVGFNISIVPGIGDHNITSWQAPAKGFAAQNDSALLVVGCALKADLFDLGTDNAVGSCRTLCFNDTVIMQAQANGGSCADGMGCCTINTASELRGFRLELVRLYDKAAAQLSDWRLHTRAQVLFLQDNFYQFNSTDLSSTWINGSTVGDTVLVGAIMDQPNCPSALMNKSTYACSTNANCKDAPNGGYYCVCPNGNYGSNPYTLPGCKDYSGTNCTLFRT
uniref:Wall-associated receptor kinase galacturonan-binding domain-containing protein n=1 Tax=Oryza brachyantha TaxID=4533 RepID=J3NC67_ORYBR